MAHEIINTVLDAYGNSYVSGVYVKHKFYTNDLDPFLGKTKLPFDLEFYKSKSDFLAGYKPMFVIDSAEAKNIIQNYIAQLTLEQVNALDSAAIFEILKAYLETIFGADEVMDYIVEDSDTTPQESPSMLDAYRVTSTATGDWAGHEDEIAIWSGAEWAFINAWENMQIYDNTAEAVKTYVSGEWV